METQREPNGKAAERLVSEPTAKPSDQVAGALPLEGPFSRPTPMGKVSTMAERQREREVVQQPAGGGLRFTVDMGQVVRFATLVLVVGGALWAIKSDLRDISTRMSYEKEIQDQRWDFQTKIQEERWQAQIASQKAVDAKLEMQRLDLIDINTALARAGIEGGKLRIQGPNGGNGR